MGEASTAIELIDLEMTFPDEKEPLLKGINLQIKEGETFVLIGPSGLGKSVLLKLMAGVIQPSGGKVMIEGKDLNKVRGKEKQILSNRMGMLFQKNALFDSLTSGENIGFPLRENTDLTEAEIEEKIKFFLDAVKIPHAKDLFPDEISGGMQKRLGIARALALSPEIIFYDDPTAGLDPITSRIIVALILKLQEKNNATVVAITNDMGRAYQMADRIGLVVDQELIIAGSPEETKNHQDPRIQQFVAGLLEGPLTKGSSDDRRV